MHSHYRMEHDFLRDAANIGIDEVSSYPVSESVDQNTDFNTEMLFIKTKWAFSQSFKIYVLMSENLGHLGTSTQIFGVKVWDI